MIICSCNVLSEEQVLETLRSPEKPRSAGETYRCLGCAPRCGRCVETVRALVAKAHLEDCQVGCPGCPVAAQDNSGCAPDEAQPEDARVILIAAE